MFVDKISSITRSFFFKSAALSISRILFLPLWSRDFSSPRQEMLVFLTRENKAYAITGTGIALQLATSLSRLHAAQFTPSTAPLPLPLPPSATFSSPPCIPFRVVISPDLVFPSRKRIAPVRFLFLPLSFPLLVISQTSGRVQMLLSNWFFFFFFFHLTMFNGNVCAQLLPRPEIPFPWFPRHGREAEKIARCQLDDSREKSGERDEGGENGTS